MNNATAVNRPGSPQLPDADGVATAALDLSHDLVAVLDDEGMIVLTNAAWQASADRRGSSLSGAGPGINYLDVCERSDAADVAAVIRGVLVGERPRYELEYSCHSPIEDAWFALEVLPLGEPPSGVVLTHTNITARVAATRSRSDGRDVEPVTMLPTTPAGVVGLARMLAGAQSRGNSLAVVTVTLPNLGDIEALHGRRSRDELVVQVVARMLRLTRGDDALVRASTNELLLFASVSDAQGGEFLCRRVAEVLASSYLVGADEIDAHASVEVTSSDRFSTLDSLLNGLSSMPVPASQTERDPDHDDNDTGVDERHPHAALSVPLVVYSLPSGFLHAANGAARALFGLEEFGRHRLRARDLADPIEERHTAAALSALSSGATDSYRAHRTMTTAEGPLALLTSVRRLDFGTGSLAVALTVPVRSEVASTPTPEDPFSAALVAGTIDARGAIESVSPPTSPMERQLVAVLTETLTLAAHPDDAVHVDEMVSSMRLRGSAVGEFRIPHGELGWVVCECQLFTIHRAVGRDSNTESRVVGDDEHVFVLSANVNAKSMVDKITRLERHIRRIGAEVHAADLEVTAGPTVDPGVAEVLNSLALTARQRDIVERLAQGQRVPSIATALFISRSTVRNHLAQVYRLVGVHSQDELLNALRAQ
ncbi:MAG TPA: LuxR C-terminal-related transcriptional regulator [Ilumatobacter sp.]|nr:LuxR C-terminal-related transcriptional regulator [Ilumatobacter sp.]